MQIPSGSGILLINLGTPDSPSPWDVGKYLREFLMDPYVVDIPLVARALLVHGLIVPFRSFKSAHAYQAIWTKEGSPLRQYHLRFTEGLQQQLAGTPVEGAMRYGRPSIKEALRKLRARGVKHLVVWPLYPQWAWASTESSIAKVRCELKKMHWSPQVSVLEDFYDHPAFIKKFAEHTRAAQTTFNADYFLFSFHGIPERHLFKKSKDVACLSSGCCDQINTKNRYCYRAQSFHTARELARALKLKSDQWEVSFQSRLGRTPWIKPYTDQRIQELAHAQRAKRLLVISPSFVADCLETLEEIQIRERRSFMQAGGEDLMLVPSLNDKWVAEAQDILFDFLKQVLVHSQNKDMP